MGPQKSQTRLSRHAHAARGADEQSRNHSERRCPWDHRPLVRSWKHLRAGRWRSGWTVTVCHRVLGGYIRCQFPWTELPGRNVSCYCCPPMEPSSAILGEGR